MFPCPTENEHQPGPALGTECAGNMVDLSYVEFSLLWKYDHLNHMARFSTEVAQRGRKGGFCLVNALAESER